MKIYLAGGEAHASSPKYNYKAEPDTNRFLSYFYDKPTSKVLDKLKGEKHRGLITIDSGAHSFFGYAGISVVHSDNNKAGEMPDPDEYFDRYVNWLHEYYDHFSYFVELDIQALLGMDKIWEWRKRLKSEGLLGKCILVHHSCNDERHLQEIMDFTECGYLGFEGKQGGKFRLPYKKLLKKCYTEGYKVHGFALTSQNVINKYPFYSVDSSSWIASVRYGILYQFKNGKMYQIKSNEESFFKHNLHIGLHNTKRDVDACNKKLKACEMAFRQLQDYMTDVWKVRGIDYDQKKFTRWEK